MLFGRPVSRDSSDLLLCSPNIPKGSENHGKPHLSSFVGPFFTEFFQVEVSQNRGNPQSSSIFMGFSIRNQPAIGVAPWRAGNPFNHPLIIINHISTPFLTIKPPYWPILSPLFQEFSGHPQVRPESSGWFQDFAPWFLYVLCDRWRRWRDRPQGADNPSQTSLF